MNINLKASYRAIPVKVPGRTQPVQSILGTPFIYNTDLNLSVLHMIFFSIFLKHERYILRLGFPGTSTC